jgi:hypothetical protein
VVASFIVVQTPPQPTLNVIAGHDPSKTGVNALLIRQSIRRRDELNTRMDARVKPAPDGE